MDIQMDLIQRDDKFPIGRLKKLCKLGKGITATAYLCRLTQKLKRSTVVLKVTDLEEDVVFCRGDGKGIDHRDVIFGGRNELVWSTEPHRKDQATILIRTSAWRLERIVARELQKVNDFLPAPVFLPIYRGWTYKYKRYVTMPFAGDVIANLVLSLKTLISVILQVLIGLSWAQKKCKFKHHDLHTENVFVRFVAVPKIWTLPDGTTMKLPDCGVQAVIADYGQSAINCGELRFARADTNNLEVDSSKWGPWDSVLQDNEGYDMTVFIDSLISDCEEPANLIFLNALFGAAKSIKNFRMSSYGRPYSKVGVTILELLHHPIFKCCS